MPTALWTGAISFGLVVIPVRLFPAVRKKTVRFHEIDRSGRRVRHVRVSEPPLEEDSRFDPALPSSRAHGTGQDFHPASSHPDEFAPHAGPLPQAEEGGVPYSDIRNGYEVTPGQYVSLSREELAALAPERSRVIDVEQFVEAADVEPIYFESRYYVAPDRDSVKAFRLLHDAMSESGKVAISWITLRQRRHLAAIRPHGEVMLLTTMVHADEVLPAEFWMPQSDAEPSEREVKMARMLIDTLSRPFNPESFTDEHRARVLKAIEARRPLEAPAAAPTATKVMDLMAALEASVKAAKAARSKESIPERKRRAR